MRSDLFHLFTFGESFGICVMVSIVCTVDSLSVSTFPDFSRDSRSGSLETLCDVGLCFVFLKKSLNL